MKTVLKNPGFTFQQTYLQALIDSGKLLPLLLERQKRLQLVRAGENWEPGDRLICLLHNPKPKLLKQLSGNTSTIRLSQEKLPIVEELTMPSSVIPVSSYHDSYQY